MRLAAPIATAVALALPLLTLGCAGPAGPAAGLATTAPVPAAAQQGTPSTAPAVSADGSGPACLANPDYATRPPVGRNSSSVEWVARPSGNGCHWVRRRV